MLCEGVILYMMLVTVLGNKLNKQRFFFILGWGKFTLADHKILGSNFPYTYVFLIGPAILIVGISVGLAHEHYGTDY